MNCFERISSLKWQEDYDYYCRYRRRYHDIIRRYAELSPSAACDILEVGGGQSAGLAALIWGDRTTVADISDECQPSLASLGVPTFIWNLARDEGHIDAQFDFVFLIEVLEHLPIPAHIALKRLRKVLKPGGVLLLTTPNLYRLRNVLFLAAGRPLFDRFDLPGEVGFGHVLEYSADHLTWQLSNAGFSDVDVELVDFSHTPYRAVDRVASVVLSIFRYAVPRFRDNLFATARNPILAGAKERGVVSLATQ